jgi:hypothetical protein
MILTDMQAALVSVTAWTTSPLASVPKMSRCTLDWVNPFSCNCHEQWIAIRAQQRLHD